MASRPEREVQLPEDTLRSWERDQAQLKADLIEEDTEEWQSNPSFAGLERVGGVDLSYVKGDDTSACASLVVLSYPDLKVLLVDGNGILHHRGFGIACHLGILTGLPCIGVAKKLLQVEGLTNDDVHKEQIRALQKGGNTFALSSSSGRILGMALRSCAKSTKPVYVSVGHKMSLSSAVRLVHSCSKFRIPEPIRQADIRSRGYIRKRSEAASATSPQPESSRGFLAGHSTLLKKSKDTDSKHSCGIKDGSLTSMDSPVQKSHRGPRGSSSGQRIGR
ncbi:endonuclease V isoform X3 [Varanus komodoensis]|uniref:endonuclease V isoform X3 n=1 Tax=Varanus komodoensis TaxID=61221 RepID=UPI001CF783FE|nr:endonuclease V isoform X3 [Varanus komodoensis]